MLIVLYAIELIQVLLLFVKRLALAMFNSKLIKYQCNANTVEIQFIIYLMAWWQNVIWFVRPMQKLMKVA